VKKPGGEAKPYFLLFAALSDGEVVKTGLHQSVAGSESFPLPLEQLDHQQLHSAHLYARGEVALECSDGGEQREPAQKRLLVNSRPTLAQAALSVSLARHKKLFTTTVTRHTHTQVPCSTPLPCLSTWQGSSDEGRHIHTLPLV
jgi:hypothetical protein